MSQTVYIGASVIPGDDIRWGDWSDYPQTWPKEDPYSQAMTLIDLCSGSDYSGDLVQRSNYEAMLADDDCAPHLIQIHGGHGTYGLGYLGGPKGEDFPCQAIEDAIAALDSYPLLDDQRHSEMEMDAESAAWSEAYGGAHDFRKALQVALDEHYPTREHDLDEMTAEDLYTLWREGCEAYNVNGGSGYVNEQSDQIHFYVKEWIGGINKPAYPGWVGHQREWHDRAQATMTPLLDAVSARYGVIIPDMDDADTTVAIEALIHLAARAYLAMTRECGV